MARFICSARPSFPGLIRLGQAMLESMLLAGMIEGVRAEEGNDLGMPAAVPGQVGEGHAVTR
jgi:hypothetical protein